MFCDNNFLFKFASLSFHFPSSTFLRVLSNKGWIWFHTSVRLLSFTSNFRRENDFASLKKSNMKSVCLPAGDSSFRIFNPLPSVPLNYSGQNPWALYSPQMSFSPLSPTNDISLWSKLCQRNLIKFVALWARFSYQEKNRLVQPKFWVQYQSSHCLFSKSGSLHFLPQMQVSAWEDPLASPCLLTPHTSPGSCHRWPCHLRLPIFFTPSAYDLDCFFATIPGLKFSCNARTFWQKDIS